MSIFGRCAATTALAVASVIAVPASAQAAAGHWTYLTGRPSDNGSSFASVSVRGSTAWVVGSVGASMIARYRHDGRWLDAPAPPIPAHTKEPTLNHVAVAGKRNVWVSGVVSHRINQGSFLSHRSTGHWRTYDLGPNQGVSGIAAFGTHDVWALGSSFHNNQVTGVARHWNGSRLVTSALPAVPEGVRGGWAFGHDAQSPYTPRLMRLVGGRWVIAAGPRVVPPRGADGFFYTSVAPHGSDDVFVMVNFFAGGAQAQGYRLYHYDGHNWNLAFARGSRYSAVMCRDPHTGIWLDISSGNTAVLAHVVAGRVVEQKALPSNSHFAFQIDEMVRNPGARSILAAGEKVTPGGDPDAALYRYDP